MNIDEGAHLMRKANREITDKKDLIEVIKKCRVCRLAFHDEPYPYIVPLSFGFSFDEDRLVLYFHCAKEGKKLELLKQNNHVSFEMDHLVNLIIEEPSCKSTMEYESVFGVGLLQLADSNEKEAALMFVMQHYSEKTAFSFDKSIVERTTVLILHVTHITGKRLCRKPE
jgi:nitroimidazol reductase NimA-like FMN-containing flavoprotein (pyridoxamine 5'-phosphate oxidase superfamily)